MRNRLLLTAALSFLLFSATALALEPPTFSDDVVAFFRRAARLVTGRASTRRLLCSPIATPTRRRTTSETPSRAA